MKENRKVQLISPKEEGEPLCCRKTQRNALCSCGGGLKQKKCCGEKEVYYCERKKK